MSYVESFLYSILTSFILIFVLNLFLKKTSTDYKNKINCQHYFFGYLFILYLMISLKEVVGFPSIQEWQHLANLNKPIFNAELNLVPFKDGLEISAILNVIFFMPFGFLLPTLWRRFRSFLPTLYYGLVFSFIIELSQLFVPYRSTDINDLIMNTLGAVLGWIVFSLLRFQFRKLTEKTAAPTYNTSKIIKLEPYIYVLVALISAFIF
ncbi:MAG: VanZ family protein [Clostridium sp.]